MAKVDQSRQGRELRLSPAGLAAAVMLLPGPFDHGRLGGAMRREMSGLEASGVVARGRLVPWAARWLTLVAAPDLHVEAVVTTPAAARVTQVWACPEAAVIGQIGADGSVQLASTEPASLAWAVREVVGLAARPEPAIASGASDVLRVPIDPVRLAHFEDALIRGDHTAADDLLDTATDRSSEELAVMAALASPERRTWRVTAHWTSGGGPEARWLSALDAGHAGLWCSQRAVVLHPPGEQRAASLMATSVAAAWKSLIALLPPGTSDTPSSPVSPDDGPAHSRRAPCPSPVPPSPTASSGSWAPPQISTSA